MTKVSAATAPSKSARASLEAKLAKRLSTSPRLLVQATVAEFVDELLAPLEDRIPELLAEVLEGAAERPTLIRASTLAARWECSPSHISKLKREGMPHVMCGSEPRFDEAECVRWLRNRGKANE